MTATYDNLLDFDSDVGLRQRLFCKESFSHPAKLHLRLLAWLVDHYTLPGDTILDPMAGIGSLSYAAMLQRNVILREVEPRWLALAHENAATIIRMAGLFAGAIDVGQADAREPWDVLVDHIIFSPPYGCASSPHETTRKGILTHRARRYLEGSLSERWGYLLRQGDMSGALGAELFHYGSCPAQIGHWRGERYWQAMKQIYTQARASLRPSGHMVLVIKDHIKSDQRVCVSDQTAALCESLGFTLHARHARRLRTLSLWQRRRRERGEPVVETEDILVFR
jgi:modification methylase